MLTEQQVRERIKALVAVEGVRGLARRLGFTPSYVSDVCNGRRAPGPPFLKLLGLRKVVGYEPTKGETMDPIDMLLSTIAHALDLLRKLPCECEVMPQGLILCRRCGALERVRLEAK